MYNKLLMQVNMLVGTVFRSIRRKFYVVSNRVTRFPYNATRSVAQKISAFTFKKETSLKDYLRFGSFYISKRYLLIASLICMAAIYFLIIFLQKFGILYYTGYPTQTTGKTGKIKIYHEQTKNLLYKGGIENGLYSKYGEEFFNAKNKPLKYRGDFKDGLYDGYGVLFSEGGNKIYKGSFTAGKYAGEGKEYSLNGRLKYSGQFQDGLYEGIGVLYDFNGKKIYSGSFSANNYDGPGMEFNEDGNIIREGNYFVGLLNGEGKTFYDSGILKYSGTYKTGLYDGPGELYFENNTLSYKGDFKDNLFDGYGVLYNKNGIKIYEGNFVKGLYEGEGSAYKDDGSLLFTGKFEGGKIVEGQKFSEEGKVTMEYGVDEDSKTKVKIFSDKGKDILKYDGGYENNAYNGLGKLYYEDEGNTVKYDGNFKDGSYHGVGTLYDISKAVIYKGYFANGSADPDQFMGKSDNDLIEVLGDPESTMESAANIIFLYPSLNAKFTLNKNNPLNVLKVVSTSLASAVDIYGTNINMSESQLRSAIGGPYKTLFATELSPFESPMPVAPPEEPPADQPPADDSEDTGSSDDSNQEEVSKSPEDSEVETSSDVDSEETDSKPSSDSNSEDKEETELTLGPGPSGPDNNPDEDNHGGSGSTSGSGNYKKLYYERSGFTFKIIFDVDTGKILTINISDKNFER